VCTDFAVRFKMEGEIKGKEEKKQKKSNESLLTTSHF